MNVQILLMGAFQFSSVGKLKVTKLIGGNENWYVSLPYLNIREFLNKLVNIQPSIIVD